LPSCVGRRLVSQQTQKRVAKLPKSVSSPSLTQWNSELALSTFGLYFSAAA